MLTGHDHVLGLLPLINLDMEHNLGTMFSVVLLFADGVLFVLAGVGLTFRLGEPRDSYS